VMPWSLRKKPFGLSSIFKKNKKKKIFCVCCVKSKKRWCAVCAAETCVCVCVCVCVCDGGGTWLGWIGWCWSSVVGKLLQIAQ
jgi:hypothetical protein